VHDGSIKDVDPTTGDSALKDSLWTGQKFEGMLTGSKAVEDIGVEKFLEVENIATIVEDIGMEKPIEIENFVVVEDINVKSEPTNDTSIVVSLEYIYFC
jgi:TATA-box binding protein (TBP) (component of TFIID and TFIIIB)